MPRDLTSFVKEDALSDMSPLGRSEQHQDQQTTQQDPPGSQDEPPMMFRDSIQAKGNQERDELHPYTQTLTLSDVDSCVILEEAAFPPHERATKEKFRYRLGKCSELSLGIFTSHEGTDIPTAATSQPVYSGAPHRKAVLLGHIVATKTTNAIVSDSDMALPSDDPANPALGNKQEGRTVAIHSLAVLPQFQRKGLGSTLLKAYLDRLAKQDVADRAALIAHEDMIPYYEKFGFKNRGKSAAQFGGGGWFDMVKEVTLEDEGDS